MKNPVAKNAHKYNKSAVMTDRYKEAKRKISKEEKFEMRHAKNVRHRRQEDHERDLEEEWNSTDWDFWEYGDWDEEEPE